MMKTTHMHSEDTVNHNDRDVNNQHLSKDSIYEPINPDSKKDV